MRTLKYYSQIEKIGWLWIAKLPPIMGGARNNFSLTTSTVVAAAVAAFKTVLQLVAPTGVIVAVQEIMISFDGTSNTASPVQVEVLRQTTAGTATARAPLKTKDTTTAIGSTGQENFTVEPTASDILVSLEIHPQAGVVYPVPLPDGEIELASATRLGLRINAVAAVNCKATIKAEE
jgi:hypothetical protein